MGDRKKAFNELKVLAKLLYEYVRPPLFSFDSQISIYIPTPTNHNECEFATTLLEHTNKFSSSKQASVVARDVLLWFTMSQKEKKRKGKGKGRRQTDRKAAKNIIQWHQKMLTFGSEPGSCGTTLRTFLTVALDGGSKRDRLLSQKISPLKYVIQQLVQRPINEPVTQNAVYYLTMLDSRSRLAPFSLISRRQQRKQKQSNNRDEIQLLGYDNVSLVPSTCASVAGWNYNTFKPSQQIHTFLTQTISNHRHVEIIDASNMTSKEFYRRYVSQGKPVLLRGLMKNWTARKCGRDGDGDADSDGDGPIDGDSDDDATRKQNSGAWSRKNLEKKYGSHFISMSKSSEIYPLQSFGRDKKGTAWGRKEILLSEYFHLLENRHENGNDLVINTEKTENTAMDPIYTFVELEKIKENQKNTNTVIGTNPVPAKIIQGEDGYFYPSNRSKNVRTILDNDFEHPSIFDPPIFPDTFSNRNKRALFAIGAAGSGVYFHKHSSTWRALVYGKTKWYLYPPGSYPGGSSFGSMNDFLKRRLENVTIQEDIEFESIQPLEIVQNEGEILYIPDLWQHATVNLQFSIGIAFEIGFYRDVEY
mgnify:CR=1 FL=1